MATAVMKRGLTGNVELHAVEKPVSSTNKNNEEMIYLEEGEFGHLRR